MRGCFFYRLMKLPADLKGKNGHFWGGGARDLYRDDVKADMGPSSRVDIYVYACFYFYTYIYSTWYIHSSQVPIFLCNTFTGKIRAFQVKKKLQPMVKLNSPMTLRARLKGGCLRWGPSREWVKSTMAWANGDILGSESSNKFITNKLWQFCFLHLSTRRFFVESIGNKKMLNIFLQQIFHYGEFQPETGSPDDEVITSSRVSWGSERDGWPHSQEKKVLFFGL